MPEKTREVALFNFLSNFPGVLFLGGGLVFFFFPSQQEIAMVNLTIFSGIISSCCKTKKTFFFIEPNKENTLQSPILIRLHFFPPSCVQLTSFCWLFKCPSPPPPPLFQHTLTRRHTMVQWFHSSSRLRAQQAAMAHPNGSYSVNSAPSDETEDNEPLLHDVTSGFAFFFFFPPPGSMCSPRLKQMNIIIISVEVVFWI